jgi:addiction module HigA family antidote
MALGAQRCRSALAQFVADRVPPRRIDEIVLGKRSITADADLRLARYFGISEGFWLGLQADHGLLQRRREIDADLARIAPYGRAA